MDLGLQSTSLLLFGVECTAHLTLFQILSQTQSLWPGAIRIYVPAIDSF